MTRTARPSNSTNRSQALEQGRLSLQKNAWGAAFFHLTTADRDQPLDPADVEALAQAALLIGKESECLELLARAHQGFLSQGEKQRAARCAYRLGFTVLLNGDAAQSGGWFARAGRLLEGEQDCPEKGYLLLPIGYRAIHGGDAAVAYTAFVQASEIGERFADIDLMTLARQGQGRALIRQGELDRGVTLLDEAMVAVTAGEVSTIVAGSVYCSVIEACGEIFDLARAQEWTSALEQWCAAQPDLVPYRGHCLIRRAELLQLHGDWDGALREARKACDHLAQPTPRAGADAAFYRVGELHRLRGEFVEAEEAYRQARQWERSPQPGFAQLRFVQGKLDAAKSAIRHVADVERLASKRSGVLDAYVDIVLASRDIAAAREAADELSAIAKRHGAPFLLAVASRATGAVLLAEGKSREALTALRQSLSIWSDLKAPYESARVRVLVALACREQGNHDMADVELEAAREVFQRLGAAPDLARLSRLTEKRPANPAGSLTEREVQVLKLVAAGKTNRGIATKLGISEKTVARHLSNIFNKLDLSSRSAATAYAYQRDLV